MNIVITGGSGGIGSAFIKALAERPDVEKITATRNDHSSAVEHEKVCWHRLDLTDEVAIKAWAAQLDEIDWLINAAGILHTPAHGPEKSIRQVDPAFFLENMSINAVPALLLAKHLHGKFRHGRPGVFATVSAKVGSIEDNRLGGWFSYRASKAALNMSLKTLAIEWRRTLPNVAVVSLHPGTTDTALSKPFQRNLPHGQLFAPEHSVSCMLSVLEKLKPADSGQFLAFDGERLPW
ncbi:MAG: SDR family NAD(P)-dependent oxidoreductase [Gammaproteobacteria bacterium]|nr:SDR family NAD(P)-dependent oxidoreductase [Gammaproteobacteria bacterium]